MTTTVYDSKQPLVAGSAFVFPVILFQRANSQLIQTTPTLVAGDVKISIDGGGYANITTLPTEVGATGELIVSLSALETTGALKYISVKFSDVAGAEWCDVVYVIDVDEAKTVSDYAGGDTAGVTTILADYARRTGDYATVGAAMSLIDDAITAAKIATDALGALELSAGASVEIAAAIWDALTAGMVTPGSIGKLLSACLAIGPGSAPYTITINDNNGNPIDGVNVWVTTDLAGANVIFNGYTDALGVVTPMLDAGDYFAWKQLAGFVFTNPQAFSAP